jgi:hypothetical protein
VRRQKACGEVNPSRQGFRRRRGNVVAASKWPKMAYDLAQARQHEGEINVKPVARRKPARAAPVITNATARRERRAWRAGVDGAGDCAT